MSDSSNNISMQQSLTEVAPQTALVRPVGSSVWHDLWADKAAFTGLLFLLLLALVAIFAPLIAPHDPTSQNIIARLKPPVWLAGGSSEHMLGTDHLGRDLLSRVIHGARISIMVGVATVLLAGSVGILVGLCAGYFGGRVDAFLVAVIDTVVAFPGLLLALLILAVIGPSATTVVVVLAFNGWMVYARVTRGIVLGMRSTPYIEAAETIGSKPRRVIFRHILPNLTAPLLTLGTLEFARIVLAEAALSFLGLGIQPPASSWGLDVASGKEYMFRAWWLVTFPGIAIALTVLSVNLLASWFRVTSDPVEREKRYARRLVKTVKRQLRRNPVVDNPVADNPVADNPVQS
ncbi:MAG: ABC transporter permease [Deinococcota bacterium]